MKEIIDSILQAEEMAEQIITEANERAKQIALQRDTDSERTKACAVLDFTAERKTALQKAEKKGEKEYDKVIAEATAEAEKLVDDAKSRVDALANEIVDGLIK